MELEIQGHQGQKFRLRNPELAEARLAEVKALAERLLRQAEERAPQLAQAASPHLPSVAGGPSPSTQLALLALVELAAEYLAARDRVTVYQAELRDAVRPPAAPSPSA